MGTITNLALLARALESDANTNILSTPNLLTLDNEEAKIVVGQNVPFITGQYAVTGSATTPTPFQTIERKDVGLTLRVKPQITDFANDSSTLAVTRLKRVLATMPWKRGSVPVAMVACPTLVIVGRWLTRARSKLAPSRRSRVRVGRSDA